MIDKAVNDHMDDFNILLCFIFYSDKRLIKL